MKNLTLLFIISMVLMGCSEFERKLTIVHNNKSDYNIIVSNNDSLTKLAALEIQYYINSISGVDIPIKENAKGSVKQIIIGKEIHGSSDLKARIESLEEDGFIIVTQGDSIIIAGSDDKSNLYGAYTFIEEFLGCRLLSVNEEFIPKSKSIKISEADNTYEPAFSYRRILFPGMYDSKYANWHKVETLEDWGMFVHTFQKLIPPEIYFNDHPEYFSLVGNHRLSDAQLCISNPEVISLLKENLRKEIEKQPDKTYWSVSQNDCYNYCECEDCMELYNKYGNVSGAYIYMANQLADEFPEKQISTLAYQFTRSAPRNIVPRENVNIMFCSIECNRSMPLISDPRSKGFVTDMKEWANLTKNIFVWDYVVQFKNYLTPFPNFHVLQPNIQFFKENNVDMMFEQGSARNWSDMADLKQYLIAKLLWNPDINIDSTVSDFLEKYYGPAEPYIKSYLDLTHNSLIDNQENEWLNIYGFPMDYTDSYLTEPLLMQYKETMDKAEESVKNDSIYLKRVLKTRLPVDFAYLDIALNKGFDSITYLEQINGNTIIKPEMLDYLDRLVEISELTGTTRINERNFNTQDYREYVLRKLSMMTRRNLAKNAYIELQTDPSDKYPVGEEAALTDNLFGDLDFHNNWLGFEGEDMIADIDLIEPHLVSQINMNFLKAVNSWVFLPVEIIVEVSADGEIYHEAARVKNDVNDENYLVKSVPITFKLQPAIVRHIRITAISLKECPEWHRGFGNPSWIFIDELIID